MSDKEKKVLQRALDIAVDLAYDLRTSMDDLHCSSCPFQENILLSICRQNGLYENCRGRWKNEIMRRAKEEVSLEQDYEER